MSFPPAPPPCHKLRTFASFNCFLWNGRMTGWSRKWQLVRFKGYFISKALWSPVPCPSDTLSGSRGKKKTRQEARTNVWCAVEDNVPCTELSNLKTSIVIPTVMMKYFTAGSAAYRLYLASRVMSCRLPHYRGWGMRNGAVGSSADTWRILLCKRVKPSRQ